MKKATKIDGKRDNKSAGESAERKALAGADRCDVFDIGRIEQLVALMKTNELTEIDLQRGKLRIQLRRGGAADPVVVAAAPVPPVLAAPAAVEGPAEESAFIKEITSPMVGTFYAKPSPAAAPFVAVGDVIGPEKTVCMIEAMKVFNEIQGELSGRVVAILARDGEAVEFGRPLFKIDTRS